MKKIALVYMVAGISSRFGGKIKQFAKIGPNKETLIEISLNQALNAGFNKIIFIVGNKTEEPFKKMFGDNYKGVPISYTLQKFNPKKRDKPWGTTDALCSAENIIHEPFVVCNGDDLYGKKGFIDLYSHLKNSDEEAILAYKLKQVLPKKGKVNRGIVKVSEGYVQDIIETFNIEKDKLSEKNLSLNNLCSLNIFALHPRVLKLLKEKLKEFKKQNKGSRNSECLLPIEIPKLIKEKKIKMKIIPAKEKWIGITNPEDEIIVRKALSLGKLYS